MPAAPDWPDLERLRADTPGTAERVHLNNAGAALMPEPVLSAIREHLDLEARIGGYEAADARRVELGRAYAYLAGLINTAPANIAVTENATAAFAQALSSIPFREGDVVVTTRHDYVSNQIQYLALAQRFGVEIVRAPDAPEGGVDVGALEGLVHRRRPRLVAVSHIPTNSGLVQDVEGVGQICRQRDVLYLVDACQSIGQMPIDVQATGCDFLSATGRKFLRGPRGTGFLYVSDGALDAGVEPLFPDLHGADWIADDLYQPAPDARRFENWEFAYALVFGLAAAARYALDLGLERIRQRSWRLAAGLRERLEGMDGVEVVDPGAERCAIVTLTVGGWDPPDLVDALRDRGINTSAIDRGSAVLDFDERGLTGALRVSPHYYNTGEELDRCVDALEELAGRGGARRHGSRMSGRPKAADRTHPEG